MFSKAFLVAGVWAAFLAYSVPLMAQDYERIAPKTPPLNETPARLPEPAAPAEPGGDQVLVSPLNGLVFLKSAGQVRKEGRPEIKGVWTEGLEILKTTEFQKLADDYLGQPVTLKRLGQLSRRVVEYYRSHDRPVVDVVVPEGQDITSGVIQFVVVEGRLGKVNVEGNHWFDTEMLEEQIRLMKGALIGEKALLSDINWLNNNPFRLVNPVIARGERVGETDLTLKVKDRFPVRFYSGYEDSGNDLTGDERVLMGFNWGNAFLLDQQLNYQFTGDLHFNKLTAHSGSWVIPLPWRHRLTFFGSHAETKADIANPLFNMGGHSWQTSSRYAVPLPGMGAYAHEASAGFDFKQSNNNLEFGGANVFNTTTEIAQWIFGYSGSFRDDWGSSGVDSSMVYSPGGMLERNKDSYFQVARANSFAEYKYARFDMNRTTRLPEDFAWIVKAGCQISDGNLLGSEQMGLGGYSTVRGYDEREANGDEGYFATTEIRTPPVSLGQVLGLPRQDDQLQFLGFFDYGGTSNRILLPGENENIQLASTGFGLRYAITQYMSLRFDYGFQLHDTGLNPRYNSRGHLGLVVSY